MKEGGRQSVGCGSALLLVPKDGEPLLVGPSVGFPCCHIESWLGTTLPSQAHPVLNDGSYMTSSTA